jgi:hypothetical protein
MNKKSHNEQKGGETDMLDILRKWLRKGTHRREAGQTPSIWVKPREADESWYVA